MKHIIIVAVLAVFAAYCWGVAKYSGTVPIPGYEVKTVAAFDAADGGLDSPAAKNRIRDLARERLLRLPADGDLRRLDWRRQLAEADFADIALRNPAEAAQFKVVDQSAVLGLVEKRLRLDENVTANGAQYNKGVLIDKKVAYDLAMARVADANFQCVKVSGQGETIAVQPGTMVMIVLIFIALLCGLKIILFEPLLKIMDERDAEISAGVAHKRANQAQSLAMEQERTEKRAAMHNAHLAALAEARRPVQLAADEMIHNAREEARNVSNANAREIAAVVKEARAGMSGVVPALARQIVEKIMGTAKQGGKK